MKINDILCEKIDQAEADKVLASLVASGDTLVAKYFQQTRHNPIHTTIDTAQRAAERLAKLDADRTAKNQKTRTSKTAPSAQKTPGDTPRSRKELDIKAKPPADDDDFELDYGISKKIDQAKKKISRWPVVRAARAGIRSADDIIPPIDP